LAMANMAATQSELLQQLADMHEKFAALAAQHQHPPPSTAPTSNPPRPSTRVRQRGDSGIYCWTHGYRVRGTHTSATCSNPNPGHQVGATMRNQMGGSIQGRPTAPSAAAPPPALSPRT
jgi:hypothetical protein